MDNVNNQGDGKSVVIENGQRVTPSMEKEQAEAEAQRRNAQRVAESGGQPVPENRKAQVKQNLFG